MRVMSVSNRSRTLTHNNVHGPLIAKLNTLMYFIDVSQYSELNVSNDHDRLLNSLCLYADFVFFCTHYVVKIEKNLINWHRSGRCLMDLFIGLKTTSILIQM